MTVDPYAVLEEEQVRTVLQRLHAEAESQTPRLLWHYLPQIPRMILGRPVNFHEGSVSGYYADKYLALEPAQAAYCYLTARSIQAKQIVEFGSSFGISTIWLAAAVRANGGGRVIGTELVPEKAEQARRNVSEAGLEDLVEIRTGDALETLRELPRDVDLLLNDGFPALALDILKIVAPSMRDGAVVLTDNVGMFRGNYREYVEYMRNPANGVDSMLLPFKSGTEISVRKKAA